MAWTHDEIEAMEEENMIRTVLEREEEMQASKPFVPPWPEDGEEPDERESETRILHPK